MMPATVRFLFENIIKNQPQGGQQAAHPALNLQHYVIVSAGSTAFRARRRISVVLHITWRTRSALSALQLRSAEMSRQAKFQQILNAETADTLRFVRPTTYRKVSQSSRKVLRYIFAELCDLLCETLRFKKSSYETADTLRFVRPTTWAFYI